MVTKKILVFGGAGQLGQCIRRVAHDRNLGSIIYLDKSEGNILDQDYLRESFEKEKPEFVINCAAYTAVDKAEDEVDLCKKINMDGAANLARCCAESGAKLIHISTDFVFEGNIPKILNEDDAVVPINIYGKTKLDGEQKIASLLEEHYIIRTSWLYSEHGNNFVKTMLKLGHERAELNVIVDQVGTPTYAIDLAGTLLDIVVTNKQDYGVYHYSNEGLCSWYDFAKAIFEINNVPIKINPIAGSMYPTKARRPAYSVMDKTKIKKTFGMVIPYWRDSLAKCIQKLNQR